MLQSFTFNMVFCIKFDLASTLGQRNGKNLMIIFLINEKNNSTQRENGI